MNIEKPFSFITIIIHLFLISESTSIIIKPKNELYLSDFYQRLKNEQNTCWVCYLLPKYVIVDVRLNIFLEALKYGGSRIFCQFPYPNLTMGSSTMAILTSYCRCVMIFKLQLYCRFRDVRKMEECFTFSFKCGFFKFYALWTWLMQFVSDNTRQRRCLSI